MSAIVTLDESYVTSTLAYVGQLFTDFKLYIVLVMGLPIGFWIIKKAIGVVGRLRA